MYTAHSQTRSPFIPPDSPAPVFLSVVVVQRNGATQLAADLAAVVAAVAPLVGDYEVVVVDNASRDDSVAVLKALTAESALPNLQIFALANEVDADTAIWVGLENALGDFVAVFDLGQDDPAVLAPMLDRAVHGADVVYAVNEASPPAGLVYRALGGAFEVFYALAHGVRFVRDTRPFRLLSRNAVNLVLRHPTPTFTYRHLAQLAGFEQEQILYSTPARRPRPKAIGASVDRGLRLLISTTRAPMRSVTWLATVAAGLNVLYSAYVVAVYVLKDDVAPGWTTLSLQTSGMFLLTSLILLVLGEYVLQLTMTLRSGTPWHVAREFTSATVRRRRPLNVVETPEGG